MLELLKLVRPYALHVTGVVLSSLVASGATAGMAFFVKYYVDDVLINTDPAYIAALPFVFILLFALKGCFVFAQGFLVRAVGAKIILDLRKNLYRHLINMPLGFFHRNPSGSLISRMLNDANVIQGNIVQGTKGLFVEFFTVVGLLAVAFWRRWDLTLITVFVLPPGLLLVNKILRRIKSVAQRAQASISNLTDVLTETFQGIKIIKAFLLENSKDASFDAENRSYYRLELKGVRLTESAALVMDVVAGLGVGFVIWYGGHLARTQQMTPGDFSSYIAAVAMVFTPMKRLATVNAKLLQAVAAHERIVSLMTLKKVPRCSRSREASAAPLAARAISSASLMSLCRALIAALRASSPAASAASALARVASATLNPAVAASLASRAASSARAAAAPSTPAAAI